MAHPSPLYTLCSVLLLLGLTLPQPQGTLCHPGPCLSPGTLPDPEDSLISGTVLQQGSGLISWDTLIPGDRVRHWGAPGLWDLLISGSLLPQGLA